MKRGSKVLALGMDAAEPSLLREWAHAGYLPTIRRLVDTGCSTDLISPALQFPDAVWPTLYTGRGPATIGRYYFIRPQPGTARLELVDDDFTAANAGEPFWVTASQHGRRCIVIDLPKIALGTPINGIQLACWGAHASHAELAAHPHEFLERLASTYGRYPLHNCDVHAGRQVDYMRLRERLLAGVESRRRLLLELLRTEPWDLFCTVFSESHCAGHHLWHLHDPRHPRHDSGGLRTALRDVYQAIDQTIGELITTAGPDVHVMIFSAHGMRPEYHGRDLLPTLLQLWGMRESTNVSPDARRERSIVVRVPFVKRLQTAVPVPWQHAVKRQLPKAVQDFLVCRLVGALRLDVRARAFYVPNNDLNPALRINLIGRDPFGCVQPGAEYDALCDFLAQRLRALINPATNHPAVEDVSIMRECCDGARRSRLPDLTALWSAEHPIDAVYSPGYGTVIGSHRDARTGGHAPHGFLAMTNHSGEPRLNDADVKDIAPTILRLLDVPVPAEIDGRSLVRSFGSRD